MKSILFFVLIFFSKTVLSGTIDPKVSDSEYLDYGSKFNCVAKIKGIVNKENFISSCVIISDNWALTAAHVVKNSTKTEIELNKKIFEIEKVIINKKFKLEVMGRNDIALCKSIESFNLNFYPELYDGKEYEKGKVVYICGYGMTGTFEEGAIKFDNKKRAGSNIIDGIYKNCLICSNLGGTKTKLEFLIATGDSGGGLFLNGKLAGINSYVFCIGKDKKSKYGSSSAHTRIKDYLNWIKENIK